MKNIQERLISLPCVMVAAGLLILENDDAVPFGVLILVPCLLAYVVEYVCSSKNKWRLSVARIESLFGPHARASKRKNCHCVANETTT